MKKTFLVFLFLFAIAGDMLAGERTFSMRIDLSETGINRALKHQYNLSGFPQQVSGTVPALNISYTLYLDLPTILFEGTTARIRMSIRAVSNIGNYENIILTPSINIPASISASQLAATLQNFSTVVQSYSGIPDWLKTAIIGAYNSYQPWLFPSKLLDNISNSWLSNSSITINDVTIASSVANKTITLTISTKVGTQIPNCLFGLYQNAIQLKSNIDCTLKELRIYSVSPSSPIEIFTEIPLKKGVTKTLYTSVAYAPGIYLSWAQFETQNSWFVLEYRGDSLGNVHTVTGRAN